MNSLMFVLDVLQNNDIIQQCHLSSDIQHVTKHGQRKTDFPKAFHFSALD